MEQELAYSFHLGSDKNKSKLAKKVAKENIQYRQTALFYKASADYGTKVANALKLDVEKVKKLASLTQQERVEATK